MSRKRKDIDDDLQPTMKLTSDGDLLVKNLLKKQLSTNSNLQTELHRNQTFISSTEYKSASDYVSGINTLSELEKTSQYIQLSGEFTAAGLSGEDMQFYLNKDKGIEYLKINHKNLDVELIEKRLSDVNNILNDYRNKKNIDDSSSTNTAGRLEMECMLSIKPNSVETNLLKFALNNDKKTDEFYDKTQALKNIEKNFMTSLDNVSDANVNIKKLQKKVQRRLRAMSKKIASETVPQVISSFDYSESSVSNSKWDIRYPDTQTKANKESNLATDKALKMMKLPPLPSLVSNSKSDEPKTQATGNRYTIRNGNIIKIENLIDFSQCTKLSLDEIRNIPKFSQYTAGSPSKILYLKNTHCLSVIDLELLFKYFNFQTKNINVMKGRMKGQAFVELENCELAEQALKQINGIIVKDRPVIIHFSPKTELPKKDESE